MRILIIHQNFPGQFRQLTPYLISQGCEITAICSHARPVPYQVNLIRYKEPKTDPNLGTGSQLWIEALSRSEIVTRICSDLKEKQWVPDCILAHSGWGESLSLNLVFPDTKLIIWPELWLKPEHGGYGSVHGLPNPSLEHFLMHVGRNLLTRSALSHADAWVLPTRHQALSFPAEFQGDRLNIIHEGIDLDVACPNPDASFYVRGELINKATPVITFVNRNLEQLRGFDTFMRSIPILQRNDPDVRIFIVGDSNKGYGEPHPSGRPIREVMLEELEDQLDMSRIHFLGRVPYPQLIALFQVSTIHVYLSHPFVLGWSLLEALACGCCVVGSSGLPVSEVIIDGYNGSLVPVNSHVKLAHRILALLRNPNVRESMKKNARESSISYTQDDTNRQIYQLILETVKS